MALQGALNIFWVLDYLKTFISDRHSGIAKHMREKLTTIKHYFEIWHLKKSML